MSYFFVKLASVLAVQLHVLFLGDMKFLLIFPQTFGLRFEFGDDNLFLVCLNAVSGAVVAGIGIGVLIFYS